jgi:hypothetical protein
MWPVSKPMVLRRSRPKRIPRSGCAQRELVVTRFAQDFEAVLSVHVGDFGECVAADRVSVAGFQSNNASGKLEKDYYEFEGVDIDIAGVRRPQLAAVSDPQTAAIGSRVGPVRTSERRTRT